MLSEAVDAGLPQPIGAGISSPGPLDATRGIVLSPPNLRQWHDVALVEALAGADVFLGVSAPNILTGDDIATMADDAVVFAMANPTPEVDPIEASKHAAVVATGRSDFSNQINNVLVFPGVFRGLLDSGSKVLTPEVLLAAADALAAVVKEEERNATYIIPSVFHPDVAGVVAAAVSKAALAAAGAGAVPVDKEPDGSVSASAPATA